MRTAGDKEHEIEYGKLIDVLIVLMVVGLVLFIVVALVRLYLLFVLGI